MSQETVDILSRIALVILVFMLVLALAVWTNGFAHRPCNCDYIDPETLERRCDFLYRVVPDPVLTPPDDVTECLLENGEDCDTDYKSVYVYDEQGLVDVPNEYEDVE